MHLVRIQRKRLKIQMLSVAFDGIGNLSESLISFTVLHPH